MNFALPDNKLPDTFLRDIVHQLEICVPNFDGQPMLDAAPEFFERDTGDYVEDVKYVVLEWLSSMMDQQDALFYEEWKGYHGELPDFASFKELDLSGYEPEPLWDVADRIEFLSPAQIPYFCLMNHALKPHGLVIIQIAAANIYAIAVKDNRTEITQLGHILNQIGYQIWEQEPLSLQDCILKMEHSAKSGTA